MELQSQWEALQERGLGLAAISYDPAATLAAFADRYGIRFPLLSDPDSTVIRRFGILNTTVQPGSRADGVPFPGTFLLDRQGVVVEKFFEEAYQERYTAARILASRGATASGPSVEVGDDRLSVRATLSDRMVAVGNRFSIVFELTPAAGIHVYAPGVDGYQPLAIRIADSPFLQVHPGVFPEAEVYHFEPLDERVPVYQRPFEVVVDVTVRADGESQAALAGRDRLELQATIEYQACDDRICYNPAALPVGWSVALRPLQRPQP